MIVTPEGLNVFPEDVERVLNHIAGVRESAVGRRRDGRRRARARGARGRSGRRSRCRRPRRRTRSSPIIRRSGARWSGRKPELPRTEGTRKLKRAAIRAVGHRRRHAAPRRGRAPTRWPRWSRSTPGARSSRRRPRSRSWALSSLERVELMVALEDAFQTRIDEGAFSEARDLSAAARARRPGGEPATLPPAEPVEFPSWNRSLARARHPPRQPADVDSAARARLRVDSRRRPGAPARRSTRPVIFAANHQSHMDTPVILARCPARCDTASRRRWRRSSSRRTSFPSEHGRRRGSPTA